jgi:putative acetyltransferase
MTEFTIRDARPQDHAAIAELNTRAFGRQDEARIVERLRADGDVMMELVAEAEGQIIGHVVFYQLRVFGKLAAMGLGPMCVDPWIQREGIGRGLLTNALAYLRQQGVALIFVLGHPDYYSKFGFNVAATADFDGPFKANPAFMALRMRYGPPMSGRLLFPDAFGVAS